MSYDELVRKLGLPDGLGSIPKVWRRLSYMLLLGA